ncbi:MAG: phosphoglycerate kinase [Mycoplasma sp.]|nr:phosphoglycerate kinase [Candidatus Hennigella equi]
MEKSLLKKIPTLQNTEVTNKRCLVRVDFNVPIKDGKITSLARIQAAKPTIDYLLKAKAKVILLSHLSRIKKIEDIKSGKKSLKIVAKALQRMYPRYNVVFIKDNRDKKLPSLVRNMKQNQIFLLENTRYQDINQKTGQLVKLESKNNLRLAKFWASLGEVFVNDAFATIHRGHASNAGVAKQMKNKCIGFLIQNELENIIKFDKYATRPITSIIGGAKISDKIKLLETLMATSNQVLIGGGMANTFLAALGINLGKSLVETEMLGFARDLYAKHKDKIILPIDLKVAKEYADIPGEYVSINKFPKELMALDVGPKTIKQYLKIIKLSKTIFWNGPTGVSEFNNYSNSTATIAKEVAKATASGAFTLIGGGDTAAAAIKFTNKNAFSFISTGGGATLAVIAGEKLPGLKG